MAGKGSIVIEKTFKVNKAANINKHIFASKEETDNFLLKIHNKESMWRWNNILSSLTLTSNKHFDVLVFNSCLDMISSLLCYERTYTSLKAFQKEIIATLQAPAKRPRGESQSSEKSRKNKGVSQLIYF